MANELSDSILGDIAPLYVQPEIRSEVHGLPYIAVNPHTGRVDWSNGVDGDSASVKSGGRGTVRLTVPETLKKERLEEICQWVILYLRNLFRYKNKEGEYHPEYVLNESQKREVSETVQSMASAEENNLRPVSGAAAISGMEMTTMWPAGATKEQACRGVIAAAAARGELVTEQEAYAAMYARLDEMERNGARLSPEQAAFIQEMRYDEKQREAMWAKPIPV